MSEVSNRVVARFPDLESWPRGTKNSATRLSAMQAGHRLALSSSLDFHFLIFLLTVLPDSISYVGGVAFGKDIGPVRTPLSTSSRFVSYVYSFLALIMINSYCANLMAFLVEEKIGLPITGVHDPKVS